jgi:hypothetical protein
LARNFGRRQGVSKERCPQWPLPERTTPLTGKRTAECVVHPAVRVVDWLVRRSVAQAIGPDDPTPLGLGIFLVDIPR